MVDQDILIAKVNNIQNSLSRIHTMTKPPHQSLLNDLTVQDVVVLNLQRAVQAVIDIAAHVVSSEKFGVPQSQKDLFVTLEKNKIISHSLSQAMQKMVGFRNIAVHDYSQIDPHILVSVVEKHLGELEEFYTAILSYRQQQQ